MNTQTQTLPRSLALAAAPFLALGLGACSYLSRQDQSTAVGAGVGAVGGAVLTGGRTIGTLGGAAIGGLIGNQVDTQK